MGKDEAVKMSAFQVFRKSNFYVAVLLITSFLMLMVIPDLVYLVVGFLKAEKSAGLTAYCYLSILLSYLVDGFIYIFLQNKVRRKLQKKMRKWKSLLKFKKVQREAHL